LHDLHAQELELLEVVMEWDAPFGIMIFDHLGIVTRPAAPIHTNPPQGDSITELRCRGERRDADGSPIDVSQLHIRVGHLCVIV
jgi:hypothetical protein